MSEKHLRPLDGETAAAGSGVFDARSWSADQEAASRILHQESWRYVAPIYWRTDPYDANSIPNNGTCFFVDTGDATFGVTAHHVIEAFHRARQVNPAAEICIRNTVLADWDDRVIGSDMGLDVVTFRVSTPELEEIGSRPLQTPRGKWPPPSGEEGRGVFFTGYAGVDRSVLDRRSIEFECTSNGVILTKNGPEELEIQIRRENLRPLGRPEVPTIMKDLGGFSGGPVMIVSALPNQLFWLGGVMLKQFAAKDDDDVVTFIARSPKCIRSNGSLITSKYVES